jgi:hypothetical protein
MTVSVAVGAQVHFASAIGTSIAMSAISNSTAAVATVGTSHGIAGGDYVVVEASGWGLLQGRVARVSGTDGTSVTLESIDTSGTASYPAGQGTGSVQKVTTWTELTQIAGVDSSGGDQNFADASSLLDVDDKQIPTSRAPTAYTFNIHDDATLAWYPTLRTVADAGSPRPMRLTKPGGGKFLSNGYWSFQENPQLSRTESTKVRVTFTASARPISYST